MQLAFTFDTRNFFYEDEQDLRGWVNLLNYRILVSFGQIRTNDLLYRRVTKLTTKLVEKRTKKKVAKLLSQMGFDTVKLAANRVVDITNEQRQAFDDVYNYVYDEDLANRMKMRYTQCPKILKPVKDQDILVMDFPLVNPLWLNNSIDYNGALRSVDTLVFVKELIYLVFFSNYLEIPFGGMENMWIDFNFEDGTHTFYFNLHGAKSDMPVFLFESDCAFIVKSLAGFWREREDSLGLGDQRVFSDTLLEIANRIQGVSTSGGNPEYDVPAFLELLDAFQSNINEFIVNQ